MTYYILDGHEAVPVDDVLKWGRQFETIDRRVARTETGHGDVSTVFLGLDHAWDGGPPMIFETMVFGGPLDQEMDRYSTWAQAEAGHAAMVERVLGASVQGVVR